MRLTMGAVSVIALVGLGLVSRRTLKRPKSGRLPSSPDTEHERRWRTFWAELIENRAAPTKHI
jgi:hypothetical protein